MSTLAVDTITNAAGTGSPSLGSTFFTGHVLQMPFTQYVDTTTVSISANTNTVIDVLTVDITPKSTSSIIKLDTHIFHEWSNQAAAYNGAWFFYRDSTKLAHVQAGSRQSGISISTISTGFENGSTAEKASYSYFDSPATTSQITYKVGVLTIGSYDLFINRTRNDTDNNQHERGISFISATEIGG